MRVLGLARAPKDLEEGQGPRRKEEEERERRVIETGRAPRVANPQAMYRGKKHTHDGLFQRRVGG